MNFTIEWVIARDSFVPPTPDLAQGLGQQLPSHSNLCGLSCIDPSFFYWSQFIKYCTTPGVTWASSPTKNLTDYILMLSEYMTNLYQLISKNFVMLTSSFYTHQFIFISGYQITKTLVGLEVVVLNCLNPKTRESK